MAIVERQIYDEPGALSNHPEQRSHSPGHEQVRQAGQQSSKGVDFDLRGDLGYGVRLLANYGYSFGRYDNFSDGFQDLSGNRPEYTPSHTANAWLTKDWKSGFEASLGAQYRSGMFTDYYDDVHLGGWTTTFSGAVPLSAQENGIQRQRGEPVQPAQILPGFRLFGSGLSRLAHQCLRHHSVSLHVRSYFFGSAQETGEGCCSCGFLKGDEFCPGGGQALGLQQQVSQVLVSPAPAQQGLDVSIDGFHDAQRDFRAAIVQDAVQVVQ